jgi:hypothetical protein
MHPQHQEQNDLRKNWQHSKLIHDTTGRMVLWLGLEKHFGQCSAEPFLLLQHARVLKLTNNARIGLGMKPTYLTYKRHHRYIRRTSA